MEWITKTVCELSVDPPADFRCNMTTTAPSNDAKRPSPILAVTAGTADLTASLGTASSSSEFQYSTLLVGSLLVIVVTAVMMVRGRMRYSSRRARLSNAADDNEQQEHKIATTKRVQTQQPPTFYNSI